MLHLNTELRTAVIKAEAAIGTLLPEQFIDTTLAYTQRKLQVILNNTPGYDDAYLPVLFENELVDQYTRQRLTFISRLARKENA